MESPSFSMTSRMSSVLRVSSPWTDRTVSGLFPVNFHFPFSVTEHANVNVRDVLLQVIYFLSLFCVCDLRMSHRVESSGECIHFSQLKPRHQKKSSLSSFGASKGTILARMLMLAHRKTTKLCVNCLLLYRSGFQQQHALLRVESSQLDLRLDGVLRTGEKTGVMFICCFCVGPPAFNIRWPLRFTLFIWAGVKVQQRDNQEVKRGFVAQEFQQ